MNCDRRHANEMKVACFTASFFQIFFLLKIISRIKPSKPLFSINIDL